METCRAASKIALWGGLECTVNRVGDKFYSQLDGRPYASGPSDLDLFASLGIDALRFPVLWERVMGTSGIVEWSWTDPRLERLRALGILPIVGLVHHGSGPLGTSLVDPQFAEKLASYATTVARRYPWIDEYTPVNEPLTTARFSGLYGLWYPHGRDAPTFKDALFNQCRGVVLAMRAIEKFNPAARLVQTEDLGTTHSTESLAYQADFNNELRWLSWDLLVGRVDQHHALWEWLRGCCKATAREILWFQQNCRPPDVIGINHYITSDRFLDSDTGRHSKLAMGGNGKDAYVDVEAARALPVPSGGIGPLLCGAWRRYGIPIAVTEVHIDAAREDQMRWFAEIWTAAAEQKSRGANVVAVTAWSLLGSRDWNSLLTTRSDYYESGAFDIRCGRARPTAVARLISELAHDGEGKHPVLAGSGWWRRSSRLMFPELRLEDGNPPSASASEKGQPILIVGANGTLGRAFARICAERDLAHVIMSRRQLDIADTSAVKRVIGVRRPWAVINAAGYVRVDSAETDAERCFRENSVGPAVLAKECARHKIALMTFSTDLVFDGKQDTPYLESDPMRPLNVYGTSKARAEALVQEQHPAALIIRTSAFFGPWDRFNFVASVVRSLRAGERFPVANDTTVSPTYVPDLVHASLDLLIDDESGIWHLTNGEAVTWQGLAMRVAAIKGIDPASLHGCPHAHLRLPAPRPRYSALGSSRSFAMPSLDDALRRYNLHPEMAAA